MNRLINLALLVFLLLSCFWLWHRPEIRNDTLQVEQAVRDLPDKAIGAVAKISNHLEDAKIPEKTKKAWENAKEEAKETKQEIKSDFNAAKEKDRENP